MPHVAAILLRATRGRREKATEPVGDSMASPEKLRGGFRGAPQLAQVPLDLLDAAEAVVDDVRNLALLPATPSVLKGHAHHDCRGADRGRREQEVRPVLHPPPV